MNSAKLKLIVGGVIIAGGLTVLGYYAVQQGGDYAIDVGQYTSDVARYRDSGLRLTGKEVAGTWQKTENRHTFKIADAKDATQVVPVLFEGSMPDTFREQATVIVAGRMGEDGVFHASEVIPQCPSKYQGMPASQMPSSYVHNKDGSVTPVFGGASPSSGT